MSTSSPVSGAAARRARNHNEMHNAILDAARLIVDEKGVDKLTLRGIAQHLGYSAGAIYEYFDSKEAIIEALYFTSTGGLGQYMIETMAAVPPETDAVERMRTLAFAYREFAHRNAELYWLTFSAMKQRPERLLRGHDEGLFSGFEGLVAVIEQGVADGLLIDTIPPLEIAFTAWSAVHGFVSLELSGHLKDHPATGEPLAADSEDHFFDQLIEILFHGFVRHR